MSDCNESSFLKDVAKHEMVIVRADGVNRHVRFAQPGTYNMHFDLITWRGYLCYTGDMGTYVFKRLDDMFHFFRTDREHLHLRDGKTLAINPSYWGEKLQAVDSSDGYRKWSKEKFESRIREAFEEWIAEREQPDLDELRAQFQDEVLDVLDHGGMENAYSAALSFEVGGQYPFQDWWEVNTDEYSYRFMWCCYALAWGVQKYDELLARGKEPK